MPRQVAEIVAPDAAAKALSLTVEIEAEEAARHALDESRLRQVLLNLMNNAVKFTPSGGVIARLTASPDALRFEIVGSVVGADVMPQQVERCRRAGMVDHIAKPIDRDTLYRVVDHWLSHDRAAA